MSGRLRVDRHEVRARKAERRDCRNDGSRRPEEPSQELGGLGQRVDAEIIPPGEGRAAEGNAAVALTPGPRSRDGRVKRGGYTGAMRSTGIVIAVLLLAGGLWWLLGADAESPAPSLKDASSVPGVAGEGAREAPALARSEAPPAPAPEPDAAVPEPVSDVAAEDGRFRIRGTISGIPKNAAAQAQVTVSALDGWMTTDANQVVGAVNDELRFDVDVSGLFEKKPGLALVEVQVDHPSAVPAKQRVDVAARGSAAMWEVAFRLEAAAVGTGIVTDEQGGPLAGAAVAAYAMTGGGLAIGKIMPVPPLHETRRDAEGRYRIRVAGAGSFLVAAAHGRRVPSSGIAHVKRGAVARIDPIILRTGEVLTGSVRYAGNPLTGCSVVARPAAGNRYHGGIFSLDGGMLSWRDGGVESYEIRRDVDEEGRFRLEGLTPGEWTVEPSGGPLAGLDCVAHACLRSGGRTVHMPSPAVDLELSGGLLLVRVLGPTGGDLHGGIQLSVGGWSTVCETSEENGARLLLPPGVECALRVSAEGYVPEDLTVTGPAEGTQRRLKVTLAAEAPRPTLLVTLRGPSGQPVKRAHFEVMAKGPPTPAVPAGGAPIPMALDGNTQTTLTSEDGIYRLERLPAGPVRLRVQPWRGFLDESGYGLTIEREIELPQEGEHRIELVAERGGRVRVAARDDAGKLLDAACLVRNAEGETIQLNYMGQAGSVMMSIPGQLGTLSPALSEPPMPAGDYTLELSFERHSKTVSVHVKPGETIVVDIKLTE